MKNLLIVFIIALFLGAGAWWYWYSNTIAMPEILPKANSFDECIKAGYPVMESYPRQCRTSDGKTFIEDIGNTLEKVDLIRLNKPRPNDIVKSPLIVEGEARGTWYFEASFPVSLYDGSGKLLARAPAEAQSEWMTENFVPFKLGLKFDTPETNTGFLVLEKDNPSGLPEHDDKLRIPVRFR